MLAVLAAIATIVCTVSLIARINVPVTISQPVIIGQSNSLTLPTAGFEALGKLDSEIIVRSPVFFTDRLSDTESLTAEIALPQSPPPLPVVRGVLILPSGGVALLSQTDFSSPLRVRAAEVAFGFEVRSIALDRVLFVWKGQEIFRDVRRSPTGSIPNRLALAEFHNLGPPPISPTPLLDVMPCDPRDTDVPPPNMERRIIETASGPVCTLYPR